MNTQKLTIAPDRLVIDIYDSKIGVIKVHNKNTNRIVVLFEDESKSCYSTNGISIDQQLYYQTLFDYNAQLHSKILTVSLCQSVIDTEGNVGKIIEITEPYFKVKFENGTMELYRYADFSHEIEQVSYKKLKTLVNYDSTKHSKYKLIEVKHHDGKWHKCRLADIIAYTEWREIQKEITLTDLIKKAGFNPEHIHVGELTCEVGQKVYHEDYGNGVIRKVRNESYYDKYIEVQFDDHRVIDFKKDGELDINYTYPELFNLVETDGLKKVLVRDNDNHSWKVSYLQSVITNKKVICWACYIEVEKIKKILNDTKFINRFDISVWNYYKEIPYISIQELWDKAKLNPNEYRLINNLN